jgi:hypothetical protein
LYLKQNRGCFLARYYRPGYDILLNPFDSRAYNWNLWDEIDSSASIDKIADSFFPDSPPDAYKGDDKWNEWGKMLFIGILEYMQSKGEPTYKRTLSLGT